MKHINSLQEPKNTYKWYIYEVIEQLKEEYEDCILEGQQKRANNDNIGWTFISGVAHGYYCALEKLRNQAEIFSIPLKEIGLEEEIKIG